MLREKEYSLRNRQNNINSLIYAGNNFPQTQRIFSNNIADKNLMKNNQQNYFISQLNSNIKINDINSCKNLNTKQFNLECNINKNANLNKNSNNMYCNLNKNVYFCNSPKIQKIDDKLKNKFDSINLNNNFINYPQNFSEALLKKSKNFSNKNHNKKVNTLKKYINDFQIHKNSNLNELNISFEKLNYKTNDLNLPERKLSDLENECCFNENLEENTMLLNTISNNENKMSIKYRDSPQEKFPLETITTSNFLNNINININNLNNQEKVKINRIPKLEVVNNSKSSIEDEEIHIGNDFSNNNKIYNEQIFENNNSKISSNNKDKLINIGYHTDKFFSPNEKVSTYNISNFNAYSSNQINNTSNIYKKNSNKKKNLSNSLTLQELINKRLQNQSNINIVFNNNSKKNDNQSFKNNNNINSLNNLENGFSNFIDVNVNLDQKNKFPSQYKIKKSIQNIDIKYLPENQEDQTNFNHNKTARAENGFGNFNNKSQINSINANIENSCKLISSHKKTQSLTNANLLNNDYSNSKIINKISKKINKIEKNNDTIKKIKNYHIENSHNNEIEKHNKNFDVKMFSEKSKSKVKNIVKEFNQELNDGIEIKSGLKTSKAGHHRITKSYNNLNLFKNEKSNKKKLVDKQNNLESIENINKYKNKAKDNEKKMKNLIRKSWLINRII